MQPTSSWFALKPDWLLSDASNKVNSGGKSVDLLGTKGNILVCDTFFTYAWLNLKYLSQKAQVQVKSRVTGVKVRVESEVFYEFVKSSLKSSNLSKSCDLSSHLCLYHFKTPTASSNRSFTLNASEAATDRPTGSKISWRNRKLEGFPSVQRLSTITDIVLTTVPGRSNKVYLFFKNWKSLIVPLWYKLQVGQQLQVGGDKLRLQASSCRSHGEKTSANVGVWSIFRALIFMAVLISSAGTNHTQRNRKETERNGQTRSQRTTW